jgi:CubicO group peptidase (beta-lactamase class C family)
MNLIFINRIFLVIFIFQTIFFASCESKKKQLKTSIEKDILIKTLEDSIPKIMENVLIPGLSIAVIRDGEILWTGTFGVKSVETKEPVTDSTIFEAASLSKPVFSYAVMKLVERGQLDMDKPLIEYTSDKYIEDNFLEGPIDDNRLRKITTRMVLTHSSGFPNWRQNNKLVINFEPGEKYSYSGEGFGYLQRVVEELTHLSLNEFMKQEVFDPLEMKYSSYVWQDRYDHLTAVPHDLMQQPLEKRKTDKGHAAASLHTTASDYARFISALINHQGLKKSTVDTMLSQQIVSRPEMTKDISWGLGIGLERTEQGAAFWHWGDNLNFRCLFIAFPEQKTGLVYFTNSYHGLAIRKKILDLAIGGNHSLFNSGYLANYGSMGGTEVNFIRRLAQDSADSAVAYYQQILESESRDNFIPEMSMNSIGYYYMNKKDYQTAIRIFKLNVAAYPDAWNVYDSLGEAYMENGDINLAIENYQKSVEINPENENGARYLRELKNRKPTTG